MLQKDTVRSYMLLFSILHTVTSNSGIGNDIINLFSAPNLSFANIIITSYYISNNFYFVAVAFTTKFGLIFPLVISDSIWILKSLYFLSYFFVIYLFARSGWWLCRNRPEWSFSWFTAFVWIFLNLRHCSYSWRLVCLLPFSFNYDIILIWTIRFNNWLLF